MAASLTVISSPHTFSDTSFTSNGESSRRFFPFSCIDCVSFSKERISTKPIFSDRGESSGKTEISRRRRTRSAQYYAAEIRRFSKDETSEIALRNVVRLMDEDGFRPNGAFSAQLLQACARCSSYELANLVHGFLSRVHLDLSGNTFICNNLIGVYAKLGCLNDAFQVFVEMNERSSISWSVIITAFCQSGHLLEAVQLFREMKREGFLTDEFTLSSVLKVSSELPDIYLGKQLHALSIQSGFHSDICVRTALISMYSNCDSVYDSLQVFGDTSSQDIASCNSLLAAYVRAGHFFDCMKLFLYILYLGIFPNQPTYASVISACASIRDTDFGRALHGRVLKDGLSDITLSNSFITLYGRCGSIDDALKLFHYMNEKNIVTWNAIIGVYTEGNMFPQAANLFRRMQLERIRPNRITMLSIVRTMASCAALEQGKELHARILRVGFEEDVALVNSLVTMYAKCGCSDKAKPVFDNMLSRDVISWNAMISAYVQNNQWKDAFKLLQEMIFSGIAPDDHSFTILIGSSSLRKNPFLDGGRKLHAYILKIATKELGVPTNNAFITMYSNCGNVEAADKVFRTMRKRDIFSWNAMMDGYAANGKGDEAIDLFLEMQRSAIRWDYLTLSILLTTCGRLLSLELCRQFHAFAIKTYPQDNDDPSYISIYNALISAYSKCGSIAATICVHERMVHTDVYSWTAMLTAYAHYGMVHEALELFAMMIAQGIKPNSITFLSLLMGCAHTGLVEKGIHYFDIMTKKYGIHPEIEHYACMIDLFGRSGQLEKAVEFMKGLPVDPGATLWKVLLGSCHLHKELDLGIEAATRIIQLEPGDEMTYVLLSNIYASHGMWEDAIKVRKMMKDRGIKKETGWSWIEIRNKRHGFVAGDTLHPQRKDIYEKLEETDAKVREMGYVPMTELVLHDVDTPEKETIISYHSEKLAVCFGILQSPPGKPIRVIKNLRICDDCHKWMNMVSLIENRLIILRDSRRFHCFKDGKCSCGDYW